MKLANSTVQPLAMLFALAVFCWPAVAEDNSSHGCGPTRSVIVFLSPLSNESTVGRASVNREGEIALDCILPGKPPYKALPLKNMSLKKIEILWGSALPEDSPDATTISTARTFRLKGRNDLKQIHLYFIDLDFQNNKPLRSRVRTSKNLTSDWKVIP